MVFFSAPLLARAAKRVGFLKLTTKRARKGYYKGKGAIPTGRHTKAGASSRRAVSAVRSRPSSRRLRARRPTLVDERNRDEPESSN
jgi:hypothetical protein